MKVALIGAGKMGLPMAQHLKAAGHTVLVHDNSEAARSNAQAAGLQVAGGLAQAVAGAGAVVSSLPHDAALLAVARP